MAGHSKWANIQYRKQAQDAKRGKIFTRFIREITVAARNGGGDVNTNPRLRLIIDKALAANMARDTIDRAIKRGTGALEGVSYEEIRYEGYGPGGVAVMVDCMTDNRVRTVAEVRHAFSKCGGNLGTSGSVAFQFSEQAVFTFAPGADEEKLLEVALEAGALDVLKQDDESVEVIGEPVDFERIQQALEVAHLKPDEAEVTWRASNIVTVKGDDGIKLNKLLDLLEDLDDTQNVYCNGFADA